MITIFSNPRPFRGHFNIIQRNAIRSWQKLQPACQIILIEDEESTTQKVATELNVEYLSGIKTNEFGTPLLDDEFRKIIPLAKFDLLAQVNIDIILLPDFMTAIERVKMRPFYMIGRRFNLDIDELIDYNNPSWEKDLRKKISAHGQLHAPTGMDYWVFPKTLDLSAMPPFAVGRPAADSWLVYHARSQGVVVIDASQAITCVHQNHPRKDADANYRLEKKRNQQLCVGSRYREEGGNFYLTIDDADYELSPQGLRGKQLSWAYLQRQAEYFRRLPEILGHKRIWWFGFYPMFRIVNLGLRLIRKLRRLLKIND